MKDHSRIRFPIGAKLAVIIGLVVLISLGTVTILNSYFIGEDVRITAENGNLATNARAAIMVNDKLGAIRSNIFQLLDLLAAAGGGRDGAGGRQIPYIERADGRTSHFFGAYQKLQFAAIVCLTAVSLNSVLEGVRATRLNNILLTGIVFFLSVAVILLFSRYAVSRHLKQLAPAASEISAGNFETPVIDALKADRRDKIGVLNQSVKDERDFLNTFAKFTNQNVAKAIAAKSVDFQPHPKDITVFFSGIRGFTAISDGFKERFGNGSAGEIISFLNDYTGRASVGLMGSADKMEYTSIGDAVNFASRTEASNKPCGIDILITEDTYSLLKEAYIRCPENNFTLRSECERHEIVVEQIPVESEVKGKGVQHFYGVVNLPQFDIQEFFSRGGAEFSIDADCAGACGRDGPKTLDEVRAVTADGIDISNTDEEDVGRFTVLPAAPLDAPAGFSATDYLFSVARADGGRAVLRRRSGGSCGLSFDFSELSEADRLLFMNGRFIATVEAERRIDRDGDGSAETVLQGGRKASASFATAVPSPKKADGGNAANLYGK